MYLFISPVLEFSLRHWIYFIKINPIFLKVILQDFFSPGKFLIYFGIDLFISLDFLHILHSTFRTKPAYRVSSTLNVGGRADRVMDVLTICVDAAECLYPKTNCALSILRYSCHGLFSSYRDNRRRKNWGYSNTLLHLDFSIPLYL